MQYFFETLYADPVYYIGLFLAFWAAIGIVTFLRGFLSGLPHLFTYDGDEEYLPLHRTRAMWGVMVVMAAWGWWELIRWVQSLFTGSGDASSWWFIALLLIPVWWPGVQWLWKTAKGGEGGH